MDRPIRRGAQHLFEKKWTPEQEQFLRDNYQIMSGRAICDLPLFRSLTRSAIVGKAKRMGLSNPNDSGAVIRRRARSEATRQLRRVPGATGPLVDNPVGPKFRGPVAPTEVVIDIPQFICTPKSLLDLKDHQCRWPVQDLFCGNAKVHGSYCAPHAALAHRKSYDYKPTIPSYRRKH